VLNSALVSPDNLRNGKSVASSLGSKMRGRLGRSNWRACLPCPFTGGYGGGGGLRNLQNIIGADIQLRGTRQVDCNAPWDWSNFAKLPIIWRGHGQTRGG